MKYLLGTHYVLWTLFELNRIDIEIKRYLKIIILQNMFLE